ncbi:MAG: aminotransferase class I/II-fold pyridoxal phosphate-dependent enzyme [Promethearchaeota archaeon]|nr:MAG: aminotransferase class I/II-fold pyridoxal phosphate-dependent enzyme [Candidatus Lokiarchaeota archaeon]
MVTRRVKDIEYAIREIAVVADQVEKSGKEVIHLNIGDPVKYDFDTPKILTDALGDAANKNLNFYVDSLGILELREEIAKLENKKNSINLTANEVIATSGVTEGIFFILASLIENNNEILIPGPTYPLYLNYAHFFDGKPVEYELNEDDDWEPNMDDLRKKISDKTQAILICSPNNPTGGIFSKKKVQKVIDLAGEYNIPVLSDEIYDQITYEKEFVSPASISKDVPVIGLNGFSKAHLVTGWRLGYMYFHDPQDKLRELKVSIAKLARARLCSNSIVQYAGLSVLKTPGTHTQELVKKLRKRRDYSYKRLRQIEGIKPVNADGAFYLFPRIELNEFKQWNNDKDFVIDLLKDTGVCTVYGSGFGGYGKDHFRLTFLPDIELLERVYNKIEDFMNKSK